MHLSTYLFCIKYFIIVYKKFEVGKDYYCYYSLFNSIIYHAYIVIYDLAK